MKDKVKVTKKQKNRLDNYTGWDGFDANSFLREHTRGFIAPENQCLNELNSMDLARCLLIGYEVEITPEEKIFEIYKTGYGRNGFGEEDIAFREGIALALHTFGIKAEGVHTLPQKYEFEF